MEVKKTLVRSLAIVLTGLAMSGCAGLGWHPVEIDENHITLPGHESGYYVYEFPSIANIKVSNARKPETTTIGKIETPVSCNCSLIVDSIDDSGNIQASFGTLPFSTMESDFRLRPGRTKSNHLLTQDLQYQLIDPRLPWPEIGDELSVAIYGFPAGDESSHRKQAVLREQRRQLVMELVFDELQAIRLAEERRQKQELELAAAKKARLENERKEQERQRIAAEAQAEAQAEADRKKREEARLAEIDRRKIQVAREQEERVKRQAYLNSPAGKAETAAKLAAALPKRPAIQRVSNSDRELLQNYAIRRVEELAGDICSSSKDFEIHSDTQFGADTIDQYGELMGKPLPAITAKVTYLCVNNIARTKKIQEAWTHAAIDRDFDQFYCVPRPYLEDMVKSNADDCGFWSE